MKKKILTIISILSLIPYVNAASYNSNMTGITVTPSKNEGGGSCNSGSYWIGFTQATYKFQGLRVSFYDESGKQVGSTFDSWDWGKYFEKNYLDSTSFYSYVDDEKLTLEKIETILTAIDNIEAEYEKVKELTIIKTSHESYSKIQAEYNKLRGYSLLVIKYVNALGNNVSKDFLSQKTIVKLIFY